jgi:hypothetical protein
MKALAQKKHAPEKLPELIFRSKNENELAQHVKHLKSLVDLGKHSDKKIKHEFLHQLNDKEKSNLGKYYTPEHLVKLITGLAKKHVNEKSKVLDLAAGCGAFLDCFNQNQIIARDIDYVAVTILSELGYKNIATDNSLKNVSREKYGLKESDHVVIIGNPPYNDSTSKNKKAGINAKEKPHVNVDDDIKANDLGISFLRAFDKLKANVVCVLHPLSYLIKETNFKRLKEFKKNYLLREGIIFSNIEFADTQKTPFPIVAALYIRHTRGMDYDYVRKFSFKDYYTKDNFILEQFETIDGYARKYPPQKKERNKMSDIGLYMHNIRDSNSLFSGGNLTEKEDYEKHITIHFKDLYKYAFLNCYRRYFEKDFRFGNLSPLVRSEELEANVWLRDVFIIDSIIHNQRLNIFNKENPENILHKKNLFHEFSEKMKNGTRNGFNIYNIVLDFLHNNPYDYFPVKSFLKRYFNDLKNPVAFTKKAKTLFN